MIRLDKFLCDLKLGTRSEVKDAIRKGQVLVNQCVEKKPEIKIDETTAVVFYKGKECCYKKFVYYMLHKPAGVITATEDRSEKTVMDLCPEIMRKGVAPVGRLDKDTEGLLLLTNDGALAHELLSPKKHVDKVYEVHCKKPIIPEMIKNLEQGVDIGEEELTRPAIVKQIETTIIHLTITEGKFHQVKRMLTAVGNEVIYLKRLQMGELVLDASLEKGSYRELTEEEIKALVNKKK